MYLENTNHLSDRELYAHLWHETLREPVVLMRPSARIALEIRSVAGQLISLLGIGDDRSSKPPVASGNSVFRRLTRRRAS